MKNIFKKIIKTLLKSILFYSIVLTVLFAILFLILNHFNLEFRQWTLVIFVGTIVLSFFAGVFQLIFKLKNKIAKIVSAILFALVALYFLSLFVVLGMLYFGIEREHVILKNGNKYLVRVYTFKQTTVYYYDYMGLFMHSSKYKIKEFYDTRTFNPYDLKSNKPRTVNYY